VEESMTLVVSHIDEFFERNKNKNYEKHKS